MTQTVVAIHSPQDTKVGQELVLASGPAKGKKVWRKQILPLGSINYEGRQIRFDSSYHRDLVRSFRQGAYSQVPFQLADSSNNHTNDPERTRGELVDLRAEPDGLYGYFELTKPAVVLNNQKLGVSCRILENYTREHDQRRFPRALQHVLGTLDPRITGMKPWEAVELASARVDTTLDLSSQSYQKDGVEMADNEEKHVVELSTAQLERLQEFLDQDSKPQQEDEDLQQELLDQFADGDPDEDDEDEGPEETEDDGEDSLALAAVANLQQQVLELTNKLDGKETEYELKQLAATGLAPSIIEAAAPLLSIGAGVLELSNGSKLSPASQTRKLLRTVLELSRKGLDAVSLDREDGGLLGSDSLEGTRKAQLAELDTLYGK